MSDANVLRPSLNLMRYLWGLDLLTDPQCPRRLLLTRLLRHPLEDPLDHVVMGEQQTARQMAQYARERFAGR
jgi:hypothetical protein